MKLPGISPFLLLACCCHFASGQQLPDLDAITGRALFEKIWVQAPSSTSASDGLGPYYNARSCSGCHANGGRGAIQPGRVLMLDDPVYGQQLQTRAVSGLPAEAGLQWISEINTAGLGRPVPQLHTLQYGALQGGYSVRLAPDLRGVASFDTVKPEQLESLADEHDANGDGISGRLSRLVTSDGQSRIGRYGWKASEAALDDQIARALNIDLGLGNPLYPDATGDCTTIQVLCMRAPAGGDPDTGFEVEGPVLDLLASYLVSLQSPEPAALAEKGYTLFRQSGCAACHVPQLDTDMGQIKAWSDLLLHDMGEGLADTLPVAHAAPSEWRTAPLWSMDAGPYLHDGRARTLEEAIRWHGGEAEAAREAFDRLNEGARRELLEFLQGL